MRYETGYGLLRLDDEGQRGGADADRISVDDLGVIQVIETAAFEFALREGEARGVDDVDAHTQAGAESQHRAGVLGDIGLVEREVERDFRTLRRAASKLAGGIVSHSLKVTLC